MKRASIATLKARLSEYLDAVKAGEEVIVTERGKPVARLMPVGAADQTEARMVHLVRAGLVRPPRQSLGKDFWKITRPKDPDGRVRAALIEERAQSR